MITALFHVQRHRNCVLVVLFLQGGAWWCPNRPPNSWNATLRNSEGYSQGTRKHKHSGLFAQGASFSKDRLTSNLVSKIAGKRNSFLTWQPVDLRNASTKFLRSQKGILKYRTLFQEMCDIATTSRIKDVEIFLLETTSHSKFSLQSSDSQLTTHPFSRPLHSRNVWSN